MDLAKRLRRLEQALTPASQRCQTPNMCVVLLGDGTPIPSLCSHVTPQPKCWKACAECLAWVQEHIDRGCLSSLPNCDWGCDGHHALGA